MKYSHMLLITLVISVIWGIIMFILGGVLRFQQTSLLNKYIQGFSTGLTLEACVVKTDQSVDLCPTKPEFSSDVDIGDWANSPGSITLVTGFLIILLSACGFIGVVKKSQGILLVMLVLIIIAIGLEYYLLDIMLDGTGSFHQGAKDDLAEKLRKDYSLKPGEVNDFTRLMNAIMFAGECCGVNGIKDFAVNMTLDIVAPKVARLQIRTPPACCDREAFQLDNSVRAFDSIMECATDTWNARGTMDGCYDNIHKDAFKVYGGGLIGFLMFLILWEGVQGILLFMIILRPPPSRKSASSDASQRSAVPVEQPKKFIPFSKISSYVSSDVNRIKSTEIW